MPFPLIARACDPPGDVAHHAGPDPSQSAVVVSLSDRGGDAVDQELERVVAGEHLVRAGDVDSRGAGLAEGGPEEVDPRVVLRLPAMDVGGRLVVGEHDALERAHEAVHRLDEVAVVEHRDAVADLGRQSKVGVRGHDLDVLAARVAANEQREQLAVGERGLGEAREWGRVRHGRQRLAGHRPADLFELELLACQLPQVVVVVARDVVDRRRELARLTRERLVDELVEHHRRGVRAGQRQLENVAGEYEARELTGLVLCRQLAERIEQGAQHGARSAEVGTPVGVQAGQDAPGRTEVQIRQADVADVRHRRPRLLRCRAVA